MSSEPPALRAYRALLVLYPREFRDEYGADMVQLLRDQFADEPAWQVCARARSIWRSRFPLNIWRPT